MTPARQPAARTGFSGWLAAPPRLRWRPRLGGRRRTVVIRAGYRHPVAAVIVGIGRLYYWLFVGAVMACVWAAPLVVWLYETMAWGAAWCGYTGWRQARWIYRRNIIGQTVRALTGRRTVRVPYDPHGAPRYPVDLATLGGQDPYDTTGPNSRS